MWTAQELIAEMEKRGFDCRLVMEVEGDPKPVEIWGNNQTKLLEAIADALNRGAKPVGIAFLDPRVEIDPDNLDHELEWQRLGESPRVLPFPTRR
jgi:hypothetical protein